MHKTCVNCSKKFKPNPRVKNQAYCNKEECQRARRAKRQKEKMAKDPDYKDNQKRCHKEWLTKHPEYYREYRKRHPDYVERNRILQQRRNAGRRKDVLVKVIAKMYSLLRQIYSRGVESFRASPGDEKVIAKMDLIVSNAFGHKMLCKVTTGPG